MELRMNFMNIGTPFYCFDREGVPREEIRWRWRYRVKPVTEVSRLLDAAGVPHVLWGLFALNLVGHSEPVSNPDIEFVVPDALLKRAYDALSAVGFELCTTPSCGIMRHDRCAPHPNMHFHVNAAWNDKGVVALFTKSSTLWWLPEFKLGPPAADDPDLLMSDDARLPSFRVKGATGPWGGMYPVKVLNENAFTEAVIRLLCRDWKHVNCYDMYWILLLDDLADDGERYPWAVKAQEAGIGLKRTLRPEWQPIWESWVAEKRMDPVTVERIQSAAFGQGLLPPPPAINGCGTFANAEVLGRRF